MTEVQHTAWSVDTFTIAHNKILSNLAHVFKIVSARKFFYCDNQASLDLQNISLQTVPLCPFHNEPDLFSSKSVGIGNLCS